MEKSLEMQSIVRLKMKRRKPCSHGYQRKRDCPACHAEYMVGWRSKRVTVSRDDYLKLLKMKGVESDS